MDNIFIRAITSPNKEVKQFHIKLKDNANDIAELPKVLKPPLVIDEVIFCADSRTKYEHFQLLFSTIEQYNNTGTHKIRNLTIMIERLNIAEDEEENIGSLEKLKNLQRPTEYFKFSASIDDNIDSMFQDLVSVLRSGTNFNQIAFRDANFMYDCPLTLDKGFTQFYEYFSENREQLLSLEFFNFDIGLKNYQQISQLIQNSRALTDLKYEFPSFLYKGDSSMYDAILNSNIKNLTVASLEMCIGLIKNSQKLEELIVTSFDRELIEDPNHKKLFKEALKTAHSLKSLSLPELSLSEEQAAYFLEENESLIKFKCAINVHKTNPTSKINEITLRNRKLQNERVRSMIVLLYNIARSSHCNNSSNESGQSMPVLPRDIWTLIVSHVKYPGVTLDFGPIARSIFKDQSIRRVI